MCHGEKIVNVGLIFLVTMEQVLANVTHLELFLAALHLDGVGRQKHIAIVLPVKITRHYQ